MYGVVMRKWVGLLITVTTGCMAISGCQSLTGKNMVDTAPKDESQLRYPEWAEEQEAKVIVSETEVPAATKTSNVEGPYGEKRSDSIDELTNFLKQLGIAHEVVPGSYLMVKIKQRIQFDTGSAFVSPHSREWLNRIGTFLAGNSNVDIVIDGHTDSTGQKMVNDKLSQRRALRVKEQLLMHQVSPGSVYTRGFGEYMPVCSNNSRNGKACNRRVELTFIITSN